MSQTQTNSLFKKMISPLTKKQHKYLDSKDYGHQKKMFNKYVPDHLRDSCLYIGEITNYVQFFKIISTLFPAIKFQILENENSLLEFPKEWSYVLSHCRCIEHRNFLDGVRNSLEKVHMYPNKKKNPKCYSYIYLKEKPKAPKKKKVKRRKKKKKNNQYCKSLSDKKHFSNSFGGSSSKRSTAKTEIQLSRDPLLTFSPILTYKNLVPNDLKEKNMFMLNKKDRKRKRRTKKEEIKIEVEKGNNDNSLNDNIKNSNLNHNDLMLSFEDLIPEKIFNPKFEETISLQSKPVEQSQQFQLSETSQLSQQSQLTNENSLQNWDEVTKELDYLKAINGDYDF
ncbi:hypothetical protein M0813_10729 [Anaeramoeba flamelloides]|uniref:Uncharacterized protein n=1 Tax=Anaeramoeba flamelloides TaxID=1746091 RepID=A0AAV7ZWV0_9EUKA|nr:hypothetical protein M0812_10207 [Anaeramoeba flamelloides]KAJ6226511.1 hypothetical protein M0813_10729 [Anaeramoeba flamelloides]